MLALYTNPSSSSSSSSSQEWQIVHRVKVLARFVTALGQNALGWQNVPGRQNVPHHLPLETLHMLLYIFHSFRGPAVATSSPASYVWLNYGPVCTTPAPSASLLYALGIFNLPSTSLNAQRAISGLWTALKPLNNFQQRRLQLTDIPFIYLSES